MGNVELGHCDTRPAVLLNLFISTPLFSAVRNGEKMGKREGNEEHDNSGRAGFDRGQTRKTTKILQRKGCHFYC